MHAKAGDGYFVDENGDMSWAKEGNDVEFDAFTAENAKGGGVLMSGRVTYELMAGFWPTAPALTVTGVNDFAVAPDTTGPGYRLLRSAVQLVIRVMGGGSPAGGEFTTNQEPSGAES